MDLGKKTQTLAPKLCINTEFILRVLTKLQVPSQGCLSRLKMVLDLLLKSGVSLWKTAHPRHPEDPTIAVWLKE